jgi:hypothetical protein
MSHRKVLPFLLILTALWLMACSGPQPAAPPTETLPPPMDSAADESSAEEQSMASGDESMSEEPAVNLVDRPAWQIIELRDAQIGETFTLADFEGRTVFVEPMATWCINCAAQLRRVADARQQLDSDQHVFIALSLETNLQDETLAAYAQRSGYEWHFAVMTPELLAALLQEFGSSVSSAPSTPHFVIRPDGSFTTLRTGAKSVEQIVSEMQTESGV